MEVEKKIFLIWDVDGAIGQINSTFPYNFSYRSLERELDNLRHILAVLDEYQVRACFAVTGFSAEEGKYPYVFPDLIREIGARGHEVASHSWRHEWTPVFSRKQIHLSLKRSKSALESCLPREEPVVGFVPPHNRPMSWLRKGAFSLGDRGVYPLFQMADGSQLIKELKRTGYRWVRVSYQNVFQKLGVRRRNPTGRIIEDRGIWVVENHYTGFDRTVIDHIRDTDHTTYTVSAHPAMLSIPGKTECRENLLRFLDSMTDIQGSVEFTTPSRYIRARTDAVPVRVRTSDRSLKEN